MIASLRGRLTHVGAETVVIEVAGVGYLVNVPARLAGELGPVGEECSLVTHTYVREDQLALYGFRTMDDLDFFLMLMSVKGIGPRAALGMLSQADTRVLKKAVFQEDAALLATVPGIGPKTAARVILELRDKLKAEYLAEDAAPGPARPVGVVDAATRALTSLGYREAEVRHVLAGVPLDDQPALETVVATALKALDSRR